MQNKKTHDEFHGISTFTSTQLFFLGFHGCQKDKRIRRRRRCLLGRPVGCASAPTTPEGAPKSWSSWPRWQGLMIEMSHVPDLCWVDIIWMSQNSFDIYLYIYIYIHIHTFSTGTGNSVTLPCPLVSDPKSFQDGRVGSFRRRRSALVNGLISGSFYRKPWLFSCTSKGKSKPCKVSLQPAFPKIG
jgi:hypothetical protein